MRNEDIIRAWKDEAYRADLADDQLTHLPAHPAGMVELEDEDLEAVAGGDVALSIAVSVSVVIATKVFSCWPWGCDDEEFTE